jgi:hypothetical protein
MICFFFLFKFISNNKKILNNIVKTIWWLILFNRYKLIILFIAIKIKYDFIDDIYKNIEK